MKDWIVSTELNKEGTKNNFEIKKNWTNKEQFPVREKILYICI